MKKICVFYDSNDIDLAKEIAILIDNSGYSSWLADSNSKVDWNTEIENIINSDSCIGAVVIWSQYSKINSIVKDEAKAIVELKKSLVGVLLNGIGAAPYGLNDGPRFDFNMHRKEVSMNSLKEKLVNIFDEGISPERFLTLGNKTLNAPTMVLSVSSFETQIEPEASLHLLKAVRPPAILISAYDLLRPVKTVTKNEKQKPNISDHSVIKELGEDGSVIFLDSGNYEAMRYQDKEWSKKDKRLSEVQNLVKVDLAFTHDLPAAKTTLENSSSQQYVDSVCSEFERDRALLDCTICPIIHAPRLQDDQYYFDLLPKICCEVVKTVNPKMIAVAERELGDGIMQRVRTIAKIRKALNNQGSSTFLHILGTGNPITMAFLSMAGADFFDGLEWCRTIIDGKRWRLYHFQQWDFFSMQSGLIKNSEIAQLVNDNSDALPWVTKAALHNIAFFIQASNEIKLRHRKKEYEILFNNLDLEHQFQVALGIVKVCNK